MNRVGHAFFKRRMREEEAIFGGEVTGHYYFRDNFYADNGFIPALLILELMSRKGQTLANCSRRCARSTSSRARSTPRCRTCSWSPRRSTRSRALRRTARRTRWTASRSSIPDWHFNVRASNTEPLLRLNLEATTQEMMERKRDEVLAFIRS